MQIKRLYNGIYCGIYRLNKILSQPCVFEIEAAKHIEYVKNWELMKSKGLVPKEIQSIIGGSQAAYYRKRKILGSVKEIF